MKPDLRQEGRGPEGPLPSFRVWPLRAGVVWRLGLAAAVLALLWPSWLGGRFGMVVVAGTSMEPTYEVGDLVLTWRAEPEVGDVVVYRIPSGAARGKLVVHRVVAVPEDGDLRTKGDNMPVMDRWVVSRGDVLGEAFAYVPGTGLLLWRLRHPVTVGVLAALVTLMALWDRSPSGETEKAPGGLSTAGGFPREAAERSLPLRGPAPDLVPERGQLRIVHSKQPHLVLLEKKSYQRPHLIPVFPKLLHGGGQERPVHHGMGFGVGRVPLRGPALQPHRPCIDIPDDLGQGP